ncbi:hypothetical protein [Mycobacterium botniense]|uniref:PD-(D/E)XK endonuclease-like domain-containing protein n=1 Tax=Mycobacterium botniense TaxID=84962 RepID=A0A7I9Y0R0_9MYCO|nr:hypothetical protein [Mycobacterium botniense]GFG75648.1 hypothetical protein MBOT_30130 [Mycobacterium botniense]
MDYRITADERTRFKRCRRQWDFASPHRRNLQPAGFAPPALPTALKDALAVYYYPGTWDWQHEVTQPLVHKALKRSLDDCGAADQFEQGAAVLDCYDAWASTVDDFAPVKVNCEVQAIVPDPAEPERGLVVHDGSAVVYPCRIDVLAVDATDEYWVVRHQIVEDWQELHVLVRDEETVAACWALEQDYLGLRIAGTIHNEVRVTGPLDRPPAGSVTTRVRKMVAQHEPSGGGRSLPQHQRVAAQTARSGAVNRTEQRTAGILRRTRIRRSRHEITSVGALIAAEAREMTGWPTIYPTPAKHCLDCEFAAPCLAITEGADPEPVLAANFESPAPATPKPRLGQSTWGFGRGAAPPRW